MDQNIIHSISEIICSADWTPEKLKQLPQEPDLLALCQELANLRSLVLSLSEGNLKTKNPANGFVANSLKEFEGNLHNVVLELNNLAKGDYLRPVIPLGDFSQAFQALQDAMFSRFTMLNELSMRYKEASDTDVLTGLPNRRAFMRMAKEAVQLAARTQRNISIIMADIDHFKLINDKNGHQTGDKILKGFAHSLRSSLRSQDLCCRWGGEEFMFLLFDASETIAKRRAEELLKNIQSAVYNYNQNTISITASFGISAFLPKSTNAEDYQTQLEQYLQLADQNMYLAKQNGRNQIYPPIENNEQTNFHFV